METFCRPKQWINEIRKHNLSENYTWSKIDSLKNSNKVVNRVIEKRIGTKFGWKPNLNISKTFFVKISLILRKSIIQPVILRINILLFYFIQYIFYLDYDECNGEGNGNNCHSEANCTNTPGSFSCACNSGYSGNGVTCTGMFNLSEFYVIYKNINMKMHTRL